MEAQSRRLEDMLVALTGQAADLSIAGAGAGAVSREELREMRDDPDVPSTRLSDTVDNLFEGANFDLDEVCAAAVRVHATACAWCSRTDMHACPAAVRLQCARRRVQGATHKLL